MGVGLFATLISTIVAQAQNEQYGRVRQNSELIRNGEYFPYYVGKVAGVTYRIAGEALDWRGACDCPRKSTERCVILRQEAAISAVRALTIYGQRHRHLL
jgi:hypothetical protein